MPLIEANLENAQPSKILPDGKWQHLKVINKPVYELTKGNPRTGSRAGNGMIKVTYEVEDGDFKGTRIFNHNIMTSGTTRDGNPMPIGNYRDMVDAMAAQGCSWKCLECGQETDQRFHRGRRGELTCPSCEKVGRFAADPDYWENKLVNGLIKTGAWEDGGEPRNEIQRIRPYAPITDADANGGG